MVCLFTRFAKETINTLIHTERLNFHFANVFRILWSMRYNPFFRNRGQSCESESRMQKFYIRGFI